MLDISMYIIGPLYIVLYIVILGLGFLYIGRVVHIINNFREGTQRYYHKIWAWYKSHSRYAVSLLPGLW